MKSRLFAVVMHNQNFVNENLLTDGIYSTEIPTLHLPDTTLQKWMDVTTQVMSNFQHLEPSIPSFIENARRCHIQLVKLSFGD